VSITESRRSAFEGVLVERLLAEPATVHRLPVDALSATDVAAELHSMHTLFVDDLEERVRAIRGRGIEPAERETYSNGVRKMTYRDPDGNEIGFGGPPLK